MIARLRAENARLALENARLSAEVRRLEEENGHLGTALTFLAASHPQGAPVDELAVRRCARTG